MSSSYDQLVQAVLQCTVAESRWATSDGLKLEGAYKEELELVRHSSDLRFEDILMRRAYYVENSGDWENDLDVFLTNDRLNAQDILRQSTDFRSWIIAPSDGAGGHTLSLLAAWRLPLVGLVGAWRWEQEEKEVLHVLCSLQRSTLLEGSEQSLWSYKDSTATAFFFYCCDWLD